MSMLVKKPRLLVDVDGVVADLMGGFQVWLGKEHSEYLDIELITRFRLPKSPGLVGLNERVNLDDALTRYLATPNVYQDFVDPIPGSIEALATLREVVDPIFITATLKEAPESFTSKFCWLKWHFGDVPVISCPSGLKHHFSARWAVDDRYDTCTRYNTVGTKGLVFGQPWSEAPSNHETYDWDGITELVLSSMEGM